ncbi:hypothetical protein [Sulfuriroseicoccus oceanibius]|uniref:Uncharacterized protein n=1 Tax=Sulfuriroseicoccus oceanibius TaxID=2707525 RepID=A0A6B3LFS7_9BACT|nr:hypothetical protein [Sulfuriroseicoccus oceanibius]QQL44612.1 hypothetical protein G3M56_012075 [Sulfuriroseicoccus oceanibius]
MRSFSKLSPYRKFLFILGAVLIGAGIGNLVKGYRDRNDYIDPLNELVSKSLNGHSKYYDTDGQAKVHIELTQEETHFLAVHQLYEKRFQTKLTRMPFWVNLVVIVIGGYVLALSLGTKLAEQAGAANRDNAGDCSQDL